MSEQKQTGLHVMLSTSNAGLALIDYQPAMYFGVYSHDRTTVMQNTQIIAKAAKLFGIPTVLSTVAQATFSGALAPEITDVFPGEPIIDRTTINSWIDPNFKAAVLKTGRKKFVLAGLWTEACVLFPALDMLAEGFEIYFVADACGDVTPEAHERAVQRLVQAGAVPITSLQFIFELQQDWARSATYEGVMEILKAHTPYGMQVRFSKWALGEHASEAGLQK
jgi:nicotinamidase-related amidase